VSRGPLFAQITADSRADIGDDAPGAPHVEAAVEALGRAVSGGDDEVVLAAFDEAGALHDVLTLDAVVARTVGSGPLSFLRGGHRRRLRDLSRTALARTAHPGALRLATALLGAVGGKPDVPDLETVAAHPSFPLHGVTALANMTTRDALGALLRLIARTEGDARVLVIDRLLAHVREPAVRLALVRDALTGLDDHLAREVAPAIVESMDVRTLASDGAAPEDLRAGAQRLLDLAGAPLPPPADDL